MDFIGPLPSDEGSDCILTMTDHMESDIQLVLTTMTLTSEELAEIFFDRWCCENRLPREVISDHDKLFMSKFWTALHKLTGVKIKASTLKQMVQVNGQTKRLSRHYDTMSNAIRRAG